jgi:hypothetical protein
VYICITKQKGRLPLSGSATPAPERFELPASSVCVNFDAVFSYIAYYFTHLGDINDKVGWVIRPGFFLNGKSRLYALHLLQCFQRVRG